MSNSVIGFLAGCTGLCACIS